MCSWWQSIYLGHEALGLTPVMENKQTKNLK